MNTKGIFLALSMVAVMFTPNVLAQGINDYAPSSSNNGNAPMAPPVPSYNSDDSRDSADAGGIVPFTGLAQPGADNARSQFGHSQPGSSQFGDSQFGGPQQGGMQNGLRRRGGRQSGGMQNGRTSGQFQQRMLAKFDSNGDGSLDENERAQLKSMRAQRRQAGQGQAGLGSGDGQNFGGGQGRAGKGNRAGGNATKAERRQKMMQKFDTNGDGTLDVSEKSALQQFREQRRQQRQLGQNRGGQTR